MASFLFAAVTGATTLCRTPWECGDAMGLCGSAGSQLQPLARGRLATLCVGFHGGTTAAENGTKALFQVAVDHYTTISVDVLRNVMGGPWSQKEQYSRIWVGTQGRRTIGQRRGVKAGPGLCNATSSQQEEAAADAAGDVCYGWALHDKTIALPNNQLATGLTVIIHLDLGVVNRIQWDSSCNLCPVSEAPHLQCKADGTGMACVDGTCYDCYAQLKGGCSASDTVCSPKIYIAWLGTDRYGQPLLSAGSVLSRFAQSSVIGLAKDVASEVSRTFCSDGVCAEADGQQSGAAPADDASPSPPAAPPSNATSNQATSRR